MDADRFALLTRAVHAGSRRGLLRVFSALGLVTPLLGLAGAEAKKKRKKKKKKVTQNPLALAYECPGPPESVLTWQLQDRVAQVFVASRGGNLRRIQFYIDKNPGSAGDYVVQLLRADDGAPLHAALNPGRDDDS